MSVPLAGKTLGILGSGRDRAGARAQGRGARDARDRHQAHAGAACRTSRRCIRTEQTDEVLGASDFVLLLLPSTPDTENFIEREAAARDEADGVAAQFRARRADRRRGPDRRGANRRRSPAPCSTCSVEEPLPATHPFWKTEGILVLPHLGGGHPDRGAAVAEIFADNARRFLAGEPLTAVVDRARGY